MKWLKRLLGFTKDMEIWHYECQEGHKWESYYSPRGTYLYGEGGQTRCPKCKTPICKGEVYVNGRLNGMGAVHEGFKSKIKPNFKNKKVSKGIIGVPT